MVRRIGFYALVAVVVAVFLFPVWYMVVSSLANDQTQFHVGLWPQAFDLTNYRRVLVQGGFVRSLGNSVVVAVVTVAASLGLSVMAPMRWGVSRFAGGGCCC